MVGLSQKLPLSRAAGVQQYGIRRRVWRWGRAKIYYRYTRSKYESRVSALCGGFVSIVFQLPEIVISKSQND
jgi:hypothetical protein